MNRELRTRIRDAMPDVHILHNRDDQDYALLREVYDIICSAQFIPDRAFANQLLPLLHERRAVSDRDMTCCDPDMSYEVCDTGRSEAAFMSQSGMLIYRNWLRCFTRDNNELTPKAIQTLAPLHPDTYTTVVHGVGLRFNPGTVKNLAL